MTVTVTTSTHFTGQALTNETDITFITNNFSTATFTATQFGIGLISPTVYGNQFSTPGNSTFNGLGGNDTLDGAWASTRSASQIPAAARRTASM
jgi:hypothetical protein